jgi:PKD repeat protein
LIDPTNTQVLYAATSQGVFKSIDAGTNWQNVKSGNYKDIKFKPGDNNTIYACGGNIARSTNAGATWATVTLPSPNAAVGRVALAVTPADPNVVYALAGESAAASYGFAGFYKSTNSGATFTKMATSPNILGWNTTGSDQGGQAWYDLVVAANPSNANEVICGGVNTWKSTNGGASFSLYTHWTGGGGKPYVHADCHAIEYLPGAPSSAYTLYIGCDGGLWKTTNGGTSFTMSSTGLQIGQQYRLGVSQTNALYTMTGWQDNGCSLTNSPNTNYVLGGDGMEVAIDPTTTSIVFGEQYNGNVNKSTNGGTSWFNIAGTGGTTGTVDEDGDWVTPYVIDPSNHLKVYVGKSQVYGSTDGGNTFTALSNFTGAGSLIALAVAPSNGNYIYAANTGQVWMTSDGSNFNAVTSPGANITYLCVDPANPQRVWATCGGYANGVKVFYSADAGTSWTNISGNLPNLPALCIAYDPSSNDGLYVGTDIGVYYKDNTMSNWIFYSNGLPNVIVHELEFHQASHTLRAATYGRGLWEIAAYTAPTSAPVAAFSSNRSTVCHGTTVNFYDNSTNLPNAWNWTFTGGTPSTSSLQSPTITYNTAGTYPVKLVATNQAGADSTTVTGYITVLPAPAVTTSNDTTICKGDSAQLCAYGGVQYQWNPITSLPNYYRQCPKAAPTITKTYTCTVSDVNGCKGTGAVTINVVSSTTSPVVYQASLSQLCCIATSGATFQWYYNGSPMTGETNQCVNITQNGTYSVTVTECGYTHTSSGFNVTSIGIATVKTSNDIEVFPNPAQGLVNIRFANGQLYQVKIFSAVGEQVFAQTVNANAGMVYPIKLSLAPGLYMVDISESGKKSLYTRKLIIVE